MPGHRTGKRILFSLPVAVSQFWVEESYHMKMLDFIYFFHLSFLPVSERVIVN